MVANYPMQTVVCGIIAFLTLPNTVQSAKFLKPEEKDWAAQRLINDAPGGRGERFGRAHEAEEKFKWSEVYRGFFNVQVWLTSTSYFAILSGLYSFGLFIPTIIQGLGITKDPNRVQLLSVVPYAVAAVITVIIAFVSDYVKLRGIVMLFTLPIAIIGYAVIANVHSATTKYGITILMATGMYASVPCVLVWNSNNSAGHYKRATTSALQLAVANCGGFVATFNYPSNEGPQYHKGHTIILGLLVYAWFG
jgi:hypothetical protein